MVYTPKSSNLLYKVAIACACSWDRPRLNIYPIWALNNCNVFKLLTSLFTSLTKIINSLKWVFHSYTSSPKLILPHSFPILLNGFCQQGLIQLWPLMPPLFNWLSILLQGTLQISRFLHSLQLKSCTIFNHPPFWGISQNDRWSWQMYCYKRRSGLVRPPHTYIYLLYRQDGSLSIWRTKSSP